MEQSESTRSSSADDVGEFTEQVATTGDGAALDRRRFLRYAGVTGLAATLGATSGCTSNDGGDETAEPTAGGEDTLTVTDTYGREVTVPSPVESFATLNPHVVWALYMLDVEDRIVGLNKGDMAVFEEVQDLPDIGWYRGPNVEKIAELQPDVLITHYRGPSAKSEIDALAEKLSKFDVAVVGIDITDMAYEELDVLGTMVDGEDKMDPFFDWMDDQVAKVEDRVADIPDEEKVSVYYESESETWSIKHDKPLELSGAHNVMADVVSREAMEQGKEPIVDPEEIVTVDPDFVLLEDVPNGSRVTGTSAAGTGPAEKMVDSFASRPGAKMLSAVETDSVHVVDYKLMNGEKSWLGPLYLAKLFYPDRFEDLDPWAIDEEYYEEWLGVDYQGLPMYPEPK